MLDIWILTIVLVAAVVGWSFWKRSARPVPDILKPGQPLPEFTAAGLSS